MSLPSIAHYRDAIRGAEFITRVGTVTSCRGLVVEATGPDTFLGELCHIYQTVTAPPIAAEVVGFRGDSVLLAPYGEVRGIRPGGEVWATGRSMQVPAGPELLGRVIDAFCQPLDDRPLVPPATAVPLYATPINPLHRSRIASVFETGVKVIDCFHTMGSGQRVGIFAGSGVGKSTLLGMVARHACADVNVIALIGERGREVRDFIEECLGPDGLSRSIVVVATSDQPPLVRTHAAFAATAIAEHFSREGQQVLLLMDSITRFAMAQREIGLAAGEPPTARGYTPSVFSLLPRLLERSGPGPVAGGAITALYTVLVEGDDMNEPVADHVRSILDGHIVLSRDLAHAGRYPPVDVLSSGSRLARTLCSETENDTMEEVVSLLALHEKSRDMIDFGAYKAGINPELDRAIRVVPEVERLCRQLPSQSVPRKDGLSSLQALLREAPRHAR